MELILRHLRQSVVHLQGIFAALDGTLKCTTFRGSHFLIGNAGK